MCINWTFIATPYLTLRMENYKNESSNTIGSADFDCKMLQIEVLKNIIGSHVERLFLIVFPPFGEVSWKDIDIRLGIVFKEYSTNLVVLSNNLDDLSSPYLENRSIPEDVRDGATLEKRMSTWMKMETADIIDLEYFDVSELEIFSNIVGQPIREVQLINIKGQHDPLGVKLLFDQDTILSFPNMDGNTIETNFFNKNNQLKKFEYIGALSYEKISSAKSDA